MLVQKLKNQVRFELNPLRQEVYHPAATWVPCHLFDVETLRLMNREKREMEREMAARLMGASMKAVFTDTSTDDRENNAKTPRLPDFRTSGRRHL